MTRHLPILTFHDLASDGAVISTDPALFTRGLERMHQEGLSTLGLAEAVELLAAKGEVPDRRFVITFDDGYRSVHELALPVLQRLGFTATVFATVGATLSTSPRAGPPRLHGRPLLAKSQLLDLQGCGIELGAHTLTHVDLTGLPPDRVEEEMVGSKSLLEDALGTPVPTFAYPFGRFDAPSRALASRHFDCACSDALGYATAASDVYTLERIDSYYLRSPRSYGHIGSKAVRAYIRARNVPRRLRRKLRRAP